MSKLTLALIVSVFLSAWYVQGIRWDNDVTAMKLSREKEKKEVAEQGEQKASAALINQRVAEAKAAALDLKYTQELKNAQSKNAALAAAYNDSQLRLRVKGICKPAPSGSLGDASGVELSGSAGRNIFTVRAGIIEDRSKINYLQSYILDLQQFISTYCPR